MKEPVSDLNRDQLTGLAHLCFDLSKGLFAFVLLPVAIAADQPVLAFVKVLLAILIGLAFVYIALILLKAKERIS